MANLIGKILFRRRGRGVPGPSKKSQELLTYLVLGLLTNFCPLLQLPTFMDDPLESLILSHKYVSCFKLTFSLLDAETSWGKNCSLHCVLYETRLCTLRNKIIRFCFYWPEHCMDCINLMHSIGTKECKNIFLHVCNTTTHPWNNRF